MSVGTLRFEDQYRIMGEQMTETHTGLPVAGYRAQPASNVDLVNRNKQAEERVLRILDELAALPAGAIDRRWFAIGRTAIEQGFMAVNRAIFQPDRVRLIESAG